MDWRCGSSGHEALSSNLSSTKKNAVIILYSPASPGGENNPSSAEDRNGM
jgi:hypothetical protein